MPRPRKLAPWMAEALDLGLDPAQIRQKVTTHRSSEARKYRITIPQMEAIYGWDLDEMASSLLHAIKHERCRGPRCGRVLFRTLVQTSAHLGLINGDIIDPDTEPVFCMNHRWCCESDNKGDRRTSMRDRATRLVAERTIAMSPITMAPITMGQQMSLFE